MRKRRKKEEEGSIRENEVSPHSFEESEFVEAAGANAEALSSPHLGRHVIFRGRLYVTRPQHLEHANTKTVN